MNHPDAGINKFIGIYKCSVNYKSAKDIKTEDQVTKLTLHNCRLAKKQDAANNHDMDVSQ